jgi:hypothetical protein
VGVLMDKKRIMDWLYMMKPIHLFSAFMLTVGTLFLFLATSHNVAIFIGFCAICVIEYVLFTIIYIYEL